MGEFALDERTLLIEPRQLLNPFPQRDLLFNELAEIRQDFLLA